jgi:hypothetical protein
MSKFASSAFWAALLFARGASGGTTVTPVNVTEYLLSDDEISDRCQASIREKAKQCERIYNDLRTAAQGYQDMAKQQTKFVADNAGNCNLNGNQALCLAAAQGNAGLLTGAHAKIAEEAKLANELALCSVSSADCAAQKANQKKMAKSELCLDQINIIDMSEDCLKWADYLDGNGLQYPPAP